MAEKRNKVQIIGAGLAGLSSAITLAKQNIACNLISMQPSERAQSVMAEGGINGAVNTMGEEDSPKEHFADTMKAGCYLADAEAVRGLTELAPEIINRLLQLGVPFHVKDGVLQLRSFGGQKKKRTAYAKSSTGKSIVTAMINEARKYEQRGLINRYSHHEFLKLLLFNHETCMGVQICDTCHGTVLELEGPVIAAFGGMNGLFPGRTTGSTANTADAAAMLFYQGVRMENLEMIQYHPTTIGIAGKRCLVSEAARGEGGRLFVNRGGRPWYFMEEKYPELGNLMPRDVVAREMYFTVNRPDCENQIYLDMRGIPKEILTQKLPDLCGEIKHYMGIQPKREPIPVEPGIHYFMGGIQTDRNHRTNIEGVYAAGECCSQYHGANRLGGNSMLGAIYGGVLAAEHLGTRLASSEGISKIKLGLNVRKKEEKEIYSVTPQLAKEIGIILGKAMGIVRNEENLTEGFRQLEQLGKAHCLNERELGRILLAEAMLQSAAFRRESRGAHFREDYPEREETYCRRIQAFYKEGIVLAFSE